MGPAIAPRQSSGRTVLVADSDQDTPQAAAESLSGEGHSVTAHQLDVSSHEALASVARANQLRVRAASVAWGERGARVNSISPGIISTAMGQ